MGRDRVPPLRGPQPIGAGAAGGLSATAVAPTPSGAYGGGTAGRPAAAQDGRAAARGMGRDRVPPLRGAADPFALARQAGWGRRGRGSDEFGPYATRPSRKPSVAGAAGQLSAARVARRFSERSVVQRIARLRRISLKRRLPERLVVQAIRTMRFRERWQSPPSTKAARKREGAKAQAPAPCFACLYQLRA